MAVHPDARPLRGWPDNEPDDEGQSVTPGLGDLYNDTHLLTLGRSAAARHDLERRHVHTREQACADRKRSLAGIDAGKYATAVDGTGRRRASATYGGR
jgi:hypothetical protein